MNWLTKLILGKSLAQRLSAKAIPLGPRLSVSGDRLVVPADNKQTYVDSYSSNAVVYAIVNLILDKVRLPEWDIYSVIDEEAVKEYERIMSNKFLTAKDYKRAMVLKAQGLEEIASPSPPVEKLSALFKYPNPDETIQDYLVATCGEKLLTGDIFDWAPVFGLGANATVPMELNWLPSQLMKIHSGNVFPARAVSYELYVFQQKFLASEILHEKYFNPDWNISGEQLYGLSPFKAGLKIINRMDSAIMTAASKFQNGGVEGVFSIDGSGLDHFDGDIAIAQAGALKTKWNEEYTGPQAAGRTIWSGYPINFTRTGMSPTDLNILESEKWDAVCLCNLLGIPPELLGLVGKTFNNVKEATKFLITGSVLPLLTSRRATFNRAISERWLPGENIYLDYDTDCYGELKADLAEVIGITSKQIMITPNEEREQLGQETRPEPLADEPWVLGLNGQRLPLSDYEASLVDAQLMADAQRQSITNPPPRTAADQNQSQNGNKPNGTTNQAGGNGKVSANGSGKHLSNGAIFQK